MSFVRPEAAQAILRYREVGIGLILCLVGIWMFLWGGLFYGVLGVLLALLGGGLGYVAWQRQRFVSANDPQGVVEVTEGQITYFSAFGGGFAARTEITEIALIFGPGDAPQWRIGQVGQPVLVIPLASQGAEALFDAFVALPGADPSRISAALDRQPTQGPITVWRRALAAPLT